MVVVAVARAEAAPARNLAVVIVAPPGTTAPHAVRTRRRAGVGGGAAYAATIPVITPFPYVSAHVVKSVAICLLCLYFPCSFIACI